MGCLWKLAADFRYGADGSCKGASVVVVIEPVQQGAVLAQDVYKRQAWESMKRPPRQPVPMSCAINGILF